MAKGVRVTLLVEDRTIERFAREVLLKLGFGRRDLFVTAYPVGRGSAKQWVGQQYPMHVKQYRGKANHQKIGLLVGTDADELTVAERNRQLDDALESAAILARTGSDRISLWIPRWNVETWIRSLSGHNVDENQNYKTQGYDVDFPSVAAEFVSQFRSTLRGEDVATLPSLSVAYKETSRITDAH